MRISLFVLSLFSVAAVAQTKISAVDNFEVRNAGTIMNKDKDVEGYFFFYIADQLKKNQNEFVINIFDKNLNEVAKKSFVDDKNSFMMSSSFNNDAMMFAVANYKTKSINLLTFDRKAEQKETISLPCTAGEISMIEMMQQYGNMNVLFPVTDKGFILNKYVHNKSMGYSLRYYPTDGGKSWEYNSPEDSKETRTIGLIAVNEKVAVAVESQQKNMLSKNFTFRLKVLDVITGKLLFEREFTKNNKPRWITNAFLTDDDKLIFMGQYFKEGDNVIDDESLGLFAEEMDLSGKTIKEGFTTWAGDVAKLMNVTGSKVKDKGYIYFHDIERTADNNYYAIGEYYTKAFGPLAITDAVVLKFNSDFKLTEVKEFAKGKSKARGTNPFVSAQLNAHMMKAFGAFDYQYTQTDTKNDRFYACFIDYERMEKGSGKNAFKTIIYDEGQLSEDKFYLTAAGKEIIPMPAKIGNVLLLEYDKKAKEITLHFEKLNIQ